MDTLTELAFTEEQARQIANKYPEFIRGLVSFDKAGMRDGVLGTKNKELIAVALSVVKQCHYCIVWHVRAAMTAGASEEEIMEAA